MHSFTHHGVSLAEIENLRRRNADLEEGLRKSISLAKKFQHQARGHVDAEIEESFEPLLENRTVH
jgi:hypothetical protein